MPALWQTRRNDARALTVRGSSPGEEQGRRACLECGRQSACREAKSMRTAVRTPGKLSAVVLDASAGAGCGDSRPSASASHSEKRMGLSFRQFLTSLVAVLASTGAGRAQSPDPG